MQQSSNCSWVVLDLSCMGNGPCHPISPGVIELWVNKKLLLEEKQKSALNTIQVFQKVFSFFHRKESQDERISKVFLCFVLFWAYPAIETGLATFKASAPPTVITLWPLNSFIRDNEEKRKYIQMRMWASQEGRRETEMCMKSLRWSMCISSFCKKIFFNWAHLDFSTNIICSKGIFKRTALYFWWSSFMF